jgi:hypothetical protein
MGSLFLRKLQIQVVQSKILTAPMVKKQTQSTLHSRDSKVQIKGGEKKGLQAQLYCTSANYNIARQLFENL